MNKQKHYRIEYSKINSTWEHSLKIYTKYINKCVNETSYILDIGCGHSTLLKNTYHKAKKTFGLDPDKNSLEKNSIIKNKIHGSVEKIPFNDNYFDVVILTWVLEHIEYPEIAFKEIYRVLKPGGKIFFITPNLYNYFVWIIIAIPNSAHSFLTKKLYNRNDGDTYPVKYKINTSKKINTLLHTIGYKKINLLFNGDPTYTSFNSITFKISLIIEKILNIKYFNLFKVHLIGIFEK